MESKYVQISNSIKICLCIAQVTKIIAKSTFLSHGTLIREKLKIDFLTHCLASLRMNVDIN